MWKSWWMIALLTGAIAGPLVAVPSDNSDLQIVDDQLAAALTGRGTCDLAYVTNKVTWCGGCLYGSGCYFGCGYQTTYTDFSSNPTLEGESGSCGNSIFCAGYPQYTKDCSGS